MNKGLPRKYFYIIIAVLILLNENVVQWMLAIFVGGHGVLSGFNDAFEYFTVSGYLFFSAFRAIPYIILGISVKSQMKKNEHLVTPIFWGGLIGIVGMIIWGSWTSLRPFYTDRHVSSTTGIAFIFIPIYAVISGFIGAIMGTILTKYSRGYTT